MARRKAGVSSKGSRATTPVDPIEDEIPPDDPSEEGSGGGPDDDEDDEEPDDEDRDPRLAEKIASDSEVGEDADAAVAGMRKQRREKKVKPKGKYIAQTRIKMPEGNYILPGQGCDIDDPAEERRLMKLGAIKPNL